MCQKSIILLFSLILLIAPVAFCQQEETNDGISEAVKAQKEIDIIDKELSKIEKEARIIELKKKIAQDKKETQAIQNQEAAPVSSRYQQVDTDLGDVSTASQIEIKMILISAENKKVLLKTDNGFLLFKVGDSLSNGWQVAEIDKESVLLKKGEELKRYRVAIW